MTESTTTRTPLVDVETDSRVGLSIEKACALIDRLQSERAELLAALREVAHHADDECGFMVDVRAAIAKAEPRA